MDLLSIRKFAEQKGVKNPAENKADLIHQIQQAEGYTACYATDAAEKCNQTSCTWRSDCLKPKNGNGKGRGKK